MSKNPYPGRRYHPSVALYPDSSVDLASIPVAPWRAAISSCSGCRRQVDTPAVTLCHDGHEPCAHAPSLPLSLDIRIAVHRRSRHQAPEIRPACELRPRLRRLGILQAFPPSPRTGNYAILDHRLDVRLLARFLVESMKVEASGTSTFAKAGFGLFTVRAHSQAITVSFLPT